MSKNFIENIQEKVRVTMNPSLMVVIILITIAIVGGIVYYLYEKHKEKEFTETLNAFLSSLNKP